MSDKPKFDKDIELLKINLVAEEIRAVYFNLLAIFFSFMIAVAVLLLALGIAIGIIVYVGTVIVLCILAGMSIWSTKRYLRRFSRLQPLIKNVEDGKPNGDISEIMKKVRE